VSYYVGLDVSLEKTAVCVLDDTGQVVVERSVPSHPEDIRSCLGALPCGEIGRVGP